MKYIIGPLLLLLSFSTYALEPRHMISFDSTGFGWSSTFERIDGDSGSPFKNADHFISNLALNYAYRLDKRFQLGVFFQLRHEEYELKNGGTSEQKIESTTLGAFVLYNFSDDIFSSYYLGFTVSNTNLVEENSQNLSDAENKAPFELDDHFMNYELLFGKRFPIKIGSMNNLSYSPQVTAFYRKHSKDFKDQKLTRGHGFSILPLRFDLLF